MDTAGWEPDVLMLSANFYDANYAEEAGDIAPNLYIQSQFHPFELADDNKATQDYLDLMEQYNPDGKVAGLGVQALSSYLLFAQAATECGSDLTAECLLENAEAAARLDRGWAARRHRPPATRCRAIATFCSDSRRTASSTTRRPPSRRTGVYNCSPDNVMTLSGG